MNTEQTDKELEEAAHTFMIKCGVKSNTETLLVPTVKKWLVDFVKYILQKQSPQNHQVEEEEAVAFAKFINLNITEQLKDCDLMIYKGSIYNYSALYHEFKTKFMTEQ